MWYLDDGTLVGSVEQVRRGWEIIQEEMPKLSLKVNTSKCEVFPLDSMPALTFREFQSLRRMGSSCWALRLALPPLPMRTSKKRVGRIQEALANLELVGDPQVELRLIRSCLGFPKFAFALRSAPPSQLQSAAAFFDDMLEEIFLMRFSVSLNEDQRSLLHLPELRRGRRRVRERASGEDEPA